MKIRTTILASIFAACCAPVFAAPQPYRLAPPPAWVVVAPDEPGIAGGAQAVEVGQSDYPLVDQQVRLSSVTARYQRYVQRLVSQADVDSSAQISIDMDPEHEKVLLHEIRVLRAGRTIDKLGDARRSLLNRERNLEDGLINGRVTLHVLLQDVRVGDVLDYSYTTERVDPIGERGYYSWFYTQWSLPVRHSRLRVLVPEGRPLHVKDLSRQPASRRTRRDGWIETVWDAHGVAALPDETARPAWHSLYPRVELSEFADWEAVRKWALPMYAVTPRDDPALSALIAEIRNEPDGQSRILRALRFVQDDIRYTGLEIGAGAWRPTQPGVVLARRYGDCKDKTLLLVTLLRALDIEAWPALVHSETGRGIADRLPSPGAFDHVIAKVRWKERDYWFDATTSGQGGVLDTVVQADFGPALVLASDAAALEQIPAREGRRAASRVLETYDFRKGTREVAGFTVQTVYSDEEADTMRVRMRSNTATKLGQEYLEYYRKSHLGVRVKEPLAYVDDRESNRFTINESYQIAEPFVKDEDGVNEFSFVAYLVTEQTGRPDQTVRTSPLARRFPMHIRHEIVAYLPGQWEIDDAHVALTDPAFEYSSNTRFKNGKLELDYELRNTSDHVAVAGLDQFLQKLDKAHDDAYFTLTYGDAAPPDVPALPASGPSISLIFTLLLGLGAGAGISFGLARLRRRLPDSEPNAKRGIGGWMVLPAFGVVTAPLFLLYGASEWLPAIADGTTLRTHGPGTQVLLCLDFFLVCALIVISLFTIWIMFGRYRAFPFAFVTLQGLAVISLVIDALVLMNLGEPFAKDLGESASMLPARILATVVWSIYVFTSQRVRATFVNSLGREPAGADAPQPVT